MTDGGALIFALADRRYAVPIDVVDGILTPPTLSRIPHAAPGLLGAGNLGGQVLPIIDPAALLPGTPAVRHYDGGGEVLRLRAAGGGVGLWIDRVERLAEAETAAAGAADAIDLEPLVRLGLSAPLLADEARHALADVSDLADQLTVASAAAFFLVEAAGEPVRLPYDAVREFIEPPPQVVVPGAPTGFGGIGILRGEALPILSLASLLGLPEHAPPIAFAVVMLASGHRLLLACGQVLGLRNTEDGRLLDPRAAIPKALRRIATGFAIEADTARAADGVAIDNAQYLAFAVDGQLYALPVEAVERVVPPQRRVALPAPFGHAGVFADAIELRGQVVPVAKLTANNATPPELFVILRGRDGLVALGAERVERLVTLTPGQIVPPPGGDNLIEGIAILGDGGDVLRILAPDRIGGLG